MKNITCRVFVLIVLTSLLVSGTYKAARCGSLSGLVTYYNTGATPLAGITVYLKNIGGEVIGSTTTNIYGEYYFEVNNAGTYSVTASSTALPGGINATDALMAAKHFVQLIQLTGLKFKAGDVDTNGYINTVDAMFIQKRFAQIITTFEIGDWVFEEIDVVINDAEDLTVDFKGLCYGDINGSYIPAECIPLPTKANAGQDLLSDGPAILLAANTPLSGSGYWTILDGVGGLIADTANPFSEFSGLTGIPYTLAWTIATVCASSTDQVVVTLQEPPFQCGSNFVDARDGQVYPTVQIGSQCWMQKNLNYGSMINGNTNQTNNGVVEKYCYNDDTANCSVYGGLYQWNELMEYQTIPSSQGICPTGWKVPASDAWCDMITYVDSTVNCTPWIYWTGTDIGIKLREAGLEHWTYGNYYPNIGNNASGFTALGAGYHVQAPGFYGLKVDAYFWGSSIIYNEPEVWTIYNANSKISHISQGEGQGFSLRCILDCDPTSAADAGPNQMAVTNNYVSLAASIPAQGETGTWSKLSGIAGSFSDIHNPEATFSGLGGFDYTLKWTLSNSCGNTASDTVNIGFSTYLGVPCPGIPSLTYMGQEYHTVQIGNQCWLRENLNVGTVVLSEGEQSNNGMLEKYCMNDDPAMCEVYGGLYQWDEMMQYDTTPGSQGICPSGWHVPTMDEWCTLTVYDTPGLYCYDQNLHTAAKLKESGYSHWMAPNTGATNSSGFTALPGGYRQEDGATYSETTYGYIWVSNTYEYQFDGSWAYSKGFRYDEDEMYSHVGSKQRGMSVRCIKDPCIQGASSDAGPDQLNLSGTTAILSANSPDPAQLGVWNVIAGYNGVFTDDLDPGTEFTGVPGWTYQLTWTIAGNCGLSIDTVTISFVAIMGSPCVSLPIVIHGGQTYNTVQIGNQCWLKENLNIGTMISTVTDQTNNMIIEKYCYNNDPAKCDTFGGLYRWDEAMQYLTNTGAQGICPAGFHIPTVTDWAILCDTLGGPLLAGGKMKETSLSLWKAPNYGANNESGFTALGAGARDFFGDFVALRVQAGFWTSIDYNADLSSYLSLLYFSQEAQQETIEKTLHFSVRCLKD